MKAFKIESCLVLLGFSWALGLWGLAVPSFAEQEKTARFAGEIFGKPITQEEFDFAYKSGTIFSLSNQDLSTEALRRQETWKNLILLKEAEKRNVEVNPEEIRKEMQPLLTEKNVIYGSYTYFQWVEENFKEDARILEKRMGNLLKVRKLIDQILNPPPPVIKDEDVKQKFLNQTNSLAAEFVTFAALGAANAFYTNITPKKWDEEKAKDSNFSTPTGHITVEALMDLWQLTVSDAYRIHAMKIDEIGAPAKMIKGYAVFRLKEKKDADLSEFNDKKKDEYIKMLKQVYAYNNSQKVLQDIVKNANLKDYEAGAASKNKPQEDKK